MTALWEIGLSDNEPRRISGESRHVTTFDWSPDGTCFAAAVAQSRSVDGIIRDSTVVVMRREDGAELRTLTENAPSWGPIKWSLDGDLVMVTIYSPRKLVGRLALVRPAGGKPSFPFSEVCFVVVVL